jgi:hypothetical protein
MLAAVCEAKLLPESPEDRKREDFEILSRAPTSDKNCGIQERKKCCVNSYGIQSNGVIHTDTW